MPCPKCVAAMWRRSFGLFGQLVHMRSSQGCKQLGVFPNQPRECGEPCTVRDRLPQLLALLTAMPKLLSYVLKELLTAVQMVPYEHRDKANSEKHQELED